MGMYIFFMVLILLAPVSCLGETGNELVRKHFDIDAKTELSEILVQQAVLRIVPIGTEINDVARRLSMHGLAHPNWPSSSAGNPVCFPDRTPIVCQFRSPRGERNTNEPNWSVEFFFDEKKGLNEIEVRRWFYSKKPKK